MSTHRNNFSFQDLLVLKALQDTNWSLLQCEDSSSLVASWVYTPIFFFLNFRVLHKEAAVAEERAQSQETFKSQREDLL